MINVDALLKVLENWNINKTKYCVFFAVNSWSCNAQVFISNDISAQVATPAVQNDNLVTQTVYGFLDFTTTIGNTIMVFSPQSSSAVTGKWKFAITL